jgi:hypothetical protein
MVEPCIQAHVRDTHSETDGSEISGHVCVDHLCSSLKIPVNLRIISHL